VIQLSWNYPKFWKIDIRVSTACLIKGKVIVNKHFGGGRPTFELSVISSTKNFRRVVLIIIINQRSFRGPKMFWSVKKAQILLENSKIGGGNSYSIIWKIKKAICCFCGGRWGVVQMNEAIFVSFRSQLFWVLMGRTQIKAHP